MPRTSKELIQESRQLRGLADKQLREARELAAESEELAQRSERLLRSLFELQSKRGSDKFA